MPLPQGNAQDRRRLNLLIVAIRRTITIGVALATTLFISNAAAAEPSAKKIVLIAGTKSHGPGHHEYEAGCRVLAHCLEHAKNLTGISAEVHIDGWPDDPATLEDAASILFFSDGSDHRIEDHPLLRGDRLKTIDRLMKKGVGFVAIHYSVFVPNLRGGPEFLEWIGGYFDYESGPGANKWYSKIATHKTTVEPASPDHPISRGLKPFDLREEYYFSMQFRLNDPRLVPIVRTAIPGEPKPQVVGWCVERKDGGRGFGFTGGHFHDNWAVPNFRKLILNALVWTAKIDVPSEGVEADLPSDFAAVPKPRSESIETLILTGHNHPAHDWKATTPALVEVLGRDPRFKIRVLEHPELLGREDLLKVDLIIQNYVNWERPGLDEQTKKQLLDFVRGGKGIVLVHFANGAFRDWPEYYKGMSRRVWVDNISGHDAYGPFRVDITPLDHPITKGMKSYDTIDELYFNQQGELPIEPLVTARSNVTKKDEPLAFAYGFGSGRVFQSLLGHAAESIRSEGTAELYRRGAAWAARRPPVGPALNAAVTLAPAAVLEPKGKFGAALKPAGRSIAALPKEIYQDPPLMIECWARLNSTSSYNLLVANSSKSSAKHWEIFSNVGSGTFCAYLPGRNPPQIDSRVPIVDGAWHYLAMTLEAGRLRLFVDGRMVADAAISEGVAVPRLGPIYFGGYPPGRLGCDGLIDDVRISKGIRPIRGVPEKPFDVDAKTIGLWDFDKLEGESLLDKSVTKNPAVVDPPFARPGVEPGAEASTAAATFKLADPNLQAVVIDRSATASYLSLLVDSAGQLFVGGRDSLFVFEPKGDGGFKPAQELIRFPPDAWVSGLEVRGNDLYLLTSNALYLIPDGRIKREGLAPQRIVWGLPLDLHVSYHALAWGPEGKLYFNSGDPLLNYGDFSRRPDHWGHWTIYAGKKPEKHPYTGVGGFFRCQPDGSGFEVVATGTRGAFGLCFDRHWNLFSNDNDHESLPAAYSPARLLHVTPGVDFGWPRGWMAEKTPERADLLETMIGTLGREAPVGQAIYDEPLIPSLRGSILLARWGQRKIDAYRIVPRGASFRAEEHPFLIGEGIARPVGVCVDSAGRIFATLSYMAANEWSPKYPSELVMIAPKHPSAAPLHDWIDIATAPATRLWSELESDSWERRRIAHTEILRRGGAILDEAVTRFENGIAADGSKGPSVVQANHLPWLTAATGSEKARLLLLKAATHRNLDLQAQSLRALTRFATNDDVVKAFLEAARDADSRIAMAGLEGLRASGRTISAEAVAASATSADTCLRQTATRLLARKGSLADFKSLAESSAPQQRLAGVLAAGTALTAPDSSDVPPESLPLMYQSPNAEFTLKFYGETVDLKKLARVGSYTIAERWGTIPPSADQKALAALLNASLTDPDSRIRLQAAYYLDLLADPALDPAIRRARNQDVIAALAKARARHVAKVWLVGPFVDQDQPIEHPPELGPIDLSASYDSAKLIWQEAEAPAGVFELRGSDESSSEASTYYAYFRLQSSRPQRILVPADKSGPSKLWQNGRLLAVEPELLLDLQPGGNDFLVRIDTKPAGGLLALRYHAKDQVIPSMPERLGIATLAQRLKESNGSARGDAVPAEFLAVDWSAAAKDGEAERGRKLFGADGLGCAKCHAITPEQTTTGGPSLAGAAARFTVPHVVESVLMPSRQVADVFRASTVVLTSGEVLTGLVLADDGNGLELLLPDATRRLIASDKIESRQVSNTSPMPAALVKKPQELKDLLAYLLSKDPKAP